jgi:hypothetical protein
MYANQPAVSKPAEKYVRVSNPPGRVAAPAQVPVIKISSAPRPKGAESVPTAVAVQQRPSGPTTEELSIAESLLGVARIAAVNSGVVPPEHAEEEPVQDTPPAPAAAAARIEPSPAAPSVPQAPLMLNRPAPWGLPQGFLGGVPQMPPGVMMPGAGWTPQQLQAAMQMTGNAPMVMPPQNQPQSMRPAPQQPIVQQRPPVQGFKGPFVAGGAGMAVPVPINRGAEPEDPFLSQQRQLLQQHQQMQQASPYNVPVHVGTAAVATTASVAAPSVYAPPMPHEDALPKQQPIDMHGSRFAAGADSLDLSKETVQKVTFMTYQFEACKPLLFSSTCDNFSNIFY